MTTFSFGAYKSMAYIVQAACLQGVTERPQRTRTFCSFCRGFLCPWDVWDPKVGPVISGKDYPWDVSRQGIVTSRE
jgi:hypothetical protein